MRSFLIIFLVFTFISCTPNSIEDDKDLFTSTTTTSTTVGDDGDVKEEPGG